VRWQEMALLVFLSVGLGVGLGGRPTNAYNIRLGAIAGDD